MVSSAAIVLLMLGAPSGPSWFARCVNVEPSNEACQPRAFSCDALSLFFDEMAFPCDEGDAYPTQMFMCDLAGARPILGRPESPKAEDNRSGVGQPPSSTSVEPAGANNTNAPAATLLAQALDELTQAYAKVNDYTATLHKQERVGGKLQPQEKILVKFRKPYSLYMKWIGTVRKDQEVLYVRGWNDGKVRAHPGSFPDLTVNLDPRSKLAMRADRHPATEASIGNIIDIMRDNLQRAAKDDKGKLAVADLGESTRFGARVRCFEITFPSMAYYGHLVRVCVFTDTKLLSRIQVWDRSQRLIESYEYQNLRTNVGLRANDFDPANIKYNF